MATCLDLFIVWCYTSGISFVATDAREMLRKCVGWPEEGTHYHAVLLPCHAVLCLWPPPTVPYPSWKSACSRKKSELPFVKLRIVVGRNRTSTDRPQAVERRSMLIHTYNAVPLLCRGLEKSLVKRNGRSTAGTTAWHVWIKHGRTVLFKWERHNINL
jgi:hypothetical protein